MNGPLTSDDNETNNDTGQGSFPLAQRLQAHLYTSSKHVDTKKQSKGMYF